MYVCMYVCIYVCMYVCILKDLKVSQISVEYLLKAHSSIFTLSLLFSVPYHCLIDLVHAQQVFIVDIIFLNLLLLSFLES